MSKRKKQQYEGIVYSTDESFDFSSDDNDVVETLPNKRQSLKIYADRKYRKGKVVTIVEGFVGNDEDLNDLAKKLKQKCGVGGSVKEGLIIIQGDLKDKVLAVLLSADYKAKVSGS